MQESMSFDLEPCLSVIVPVYNVPQEYLEKCIESILYQNYTNVELILIDDGSVSSIAECCDRYGNLDDRIRIVHKENGGVSSARNTGLALASGDYVTFVDGDDWIEPNHLLQGMRYILDTQTEIVFLGAKIEKGGEIHKSPFMSTDPFVMTSLDARYCLMKRTLVGWGVASKIFKKKTITDIYFDKEISMAEDLDFCWRALTVARKVAYFPSSGYHYCQREDSATHAVTPEKRITGVKVFYKILQELSDGELRDLVQIRYIKEMASCMMSIYRDKGLVYEAEIKSYKKVLQKNIFSFVRTPYYGVKIKLAVLLLATLPSSIFRRVVRL